MRWAQIMGSTARNIFVKGKKIYKGARTAQRLEIIDIYESLYGIGHSKFIQNTTICILRLKSTNFKWERICGRWNDIKWTNLSKTSIKSNRKNIYVALKKIQKIQWYWISEWRNEDEDFSCGFFFGWKTSVVFVSIILIISSLNMDSA